MAARVVAFVPGIYGAPGIHDVCGEVRFDGGRWVEVVFGESDGKLVLDVEAG